MKGPEYQRTQRITEALRAFGWRHVWFRAAKTDKGYRTPLSGDKGYVDITAVHPSRGILLLCEVKSDRGKLSPEQMAWRDALAQVEQVACAARKIMPVRYWLCDSAASEAELLELISGGRL